MSVVDQRSNGRPIKTCFGDDAHKKPFLVDDALARLHLLSGALADGEGRGPVRCVSRNDLHGYELKVAALLFQVQQLPKTFVFFVCRLGLARASSIWAILMRSCSFSFRYASYCAI
jgi:hypothetical protein